MLATLAHHTSFVGRKILTATALGFIGLIVGFGCALLPPGVPLSIVAIAALILLWTMPDLIATPMALTRFLIWPFLFSILCVPVYYAIILPGIPWISLRRAFLFALLAPLIITVAGSSTNRRLIWDRFGACKPVTICIVGFLAIMAASTVLGIRVIQSANSDFLMITTCFLPMIAIVLGARDHAFVQRLFKLAIACVTVNFITGAIEFVLKKPFLIYILPPYMREQIFAANPLAANSFIAGQGMRGGMYRASSTFTNALTWGECSAMLVPFCLHFIAHGKTPRERAYGMIGIVLCLLSVVLSGSRGAYVGMIVAMIAYSIIWALRSCRIHPEHLAGQIWLFLYMLGSTAAALGILFVPKLHAVVLGGGDAQNSTNARYAEWALAKPKILARPLWGYGGGQAGDVIHYPVGGFAGNPLTIDGYFMNLLVDYGIPGFLLFSGIFFVAAFYCIYIYFWTDSADGTWGGAVGASIIAFILYRITLSQADNLGLAFILIALAIVYCHMMMKKPGETQPRANRPLVFERNAELG